MIGLHIAQVAEQLSATQCGNDVVFHCYATDSRHALAQTLFVALRGERFDGHDFIEQARQNGAVAALVDRAVETDLPTLHVADTRIALGQLAKLWRSLGQLDHVAAVTGSNGKTTVKEMLRQIFSQCGEVLATQGNFNNEIGVPLTLAQLQAEQHYAVIEMGANHRGEIAYLCDMVQPTVAVITQCAPAHLEGFGSIEGVAAAKGEIFSQLPIDGVAVINADDAFADFWRGLTQHCRQVTFSVNTTADVYATNVQLDATGSRFQLHTPQGEIAQRLNLLGQHNVLNALAAAACALQCACSLQQIQTGLAQVQAVKGRLQSVPGLHGSVLLDDTYNANPRSLQAALDVLAQLPAPHWLVVGDMGELGEQSDDFHRAIGTQANQAGVSHMWTLGKGSSKAAETFDGVVQTFTDVEALIAALQIALTTSTTVLVKGSRAMQMERVVKALAV